MPSRLVLWVSLCHYHVNREAALFPALALAVPCMLLHLSSLHLVVLQSFQRVRVSELAGRRAATSVQPGVLKRKVARMMQARKRWSWKAWVRHTRPLQSFLPAKRSRCPSTHDLYNVLTCKGSLEQSQLAWKLTLSIRLLSLPMKNEGFATDDPQWKCLHKMHESTCTPDHTILWYV